MLWPAKLPLAFAVSANWGNSFCSPVLPWKGPERLAVRLPPWAPSAETLRVRSSFPLVTEAWLPKVSLRTACGSSPPPPLPKQPATASGMASARIAAARRDGIRFKVGSVVSWGALRRASVHSAGRGRAENHPLHGQGRRGKDERGRRDGAPLRPRRPANRRALDRSGPQPLRLAGRPARSRPDAGRRAALGPGGAGAARDGGPLERRQPLAGPAPRRPRDARHHGRGAHRAARDGRALQPPADQAPPRRG